MRFVYFDHRTKFMVILTCTWKNTFLHTIGIKFSPKFASTIVDIFVVKPPIICHPSMERSLINKIENGLKIILGTGQRPFTSEKIECSRMETEI